MPRMRSFGMVLGAATLVLAAGSAPAFHTPFAYRVDRFEADGNRLGAADGVPDFTDDFADGSMSPSWYTAYGTAAESGGYLVLQNPGVHFPSPDGSALDLSIAGSSSPTWVYDGMGDFTATAYWEGVVPPVGHHYHFSVYTFGGGGGVFSETFGLAVRATDTTVDVEQHLTEIDQYAGIFQNTQLLYHQIDPRDVTGHLVFQIHFEDATNTVTTAFSLDGGSTWQSPFPPATIFVGRTTAQFLLSADPFSEAAVTTTTIVSSTTTTTLSPLCLPTGCRRSTQPFKTRLSVKDKPSARADMLHWKWKKGEDTPFGAFGASFSTNYEVCIGDAAGNVLFHEFIVHDLGSCGGAACWRQTGNGWKLTSDGVQTAGIRKVLLKSGLDGMAMVTVKAQGEYLALPALPLPLPLTVRVSNTDGECWAETFSAAGMAENTAIKFSGRAGSPSGAFVE